MRRALFTPDTYAEVARLVAQNYRAEHIAAHIGCKLSTLKVKCSQARVSLRRPNWKERFAASPTDLPKAFVEDKLPAALPVKGQRRLVMQSSLLLSRVARSRLAQRAHEVGKSEVQLASELLEVIALDDLYDAVLDRAA